MTAPYSPAIPRDAAPVRVTLIESSPVLGRRPPVFVVSVSDPPISVRLTVSQAADLTRRLSAALVSLDGES